MKCLLEKLKKETELETRLSREDYDRMLKSIRQMMSVDTTALLKNITLAELKLIYCVDEHFKEHGRPFPPQKPLNSLEYPLPRFQEQ